jgi:hypothetical protein
VVERISNQSRESSEHCKQESQRFTGAGLPIQQATPVRKMKLSVSRIHVGLAGQGRCSCHTGDSQWCAPVTYVPATDSPSCALCVMRQNTNRAITL